MRLQYDISITGSAAVNRALSGMERRFVRHNRALIRTSKQMARTPMGLDAIDNKRHGVRMKHLAKERAMAVANARAAANAEISADRRAHSRRMSNMRREATAARTVQRSLFGGTRGRVGGAMRSVGVMGSMLLGLGGGMLSAGAFKSMTSKDKAARALANQAYGTSGAKGQSREALKASILGTSSPLALATGTGEADIIGGMRQFMSKAGDINAAQTIAPFLLDLADASQTDLASAGEAAGNIFMSAMAKGLDGNTALQQTVEILKVIGGQAKEGSIELKDMATQAGKLMSAAGAFSGDSADLANTMGAVAQLALAGRAASPEEAMTALGRLADDLAAKGENQAFRRAGINVFSDKSKTALRDPADLIMESVAKTGGNLPQLMDMFGVRARKAIEPFRGAYVQAGGGEKGEAAMRAQFARFKSLKMTGTEIRQSAAFARDNDTTRMAKIQERLHQKLGPAIMRMISRLIPEFEAIIPHLVKTGESFARVATTVIPAFAKLAPHIEDAAEAFADFVSWFADDPITGIGAVIAASVTADIAKAGIGRLTGQAIGGALSGAGPLMANPVGLAIGGALAAVLTAGLIMEYLNRQQEKKDKANLEKASGKSGVAKRADGTYVHYDDQGNIQTREGKFALPGDTGAHETIRKGLFQMGQGKAAGLLGVEPFQLNDPTGELGKAQATRDGAAIRSVEGAANQFDQVAAKQAAAVERFDGTIGKLDGILGKYADGPGLSRGPSPTDPR